MGLKRLKNTGFFEKNKYRLERANDLLSFFSGLCLILFLCGDQSVLNIKGQFLNNEIKMTALVTGLHTGQYEIDGKVLKAMANVPRHDFIHQPFDHYAYINVALPIPEHDIVIPEPFVTAMMVHLLDIEKHHKVLEIGYGDTGYDAAVISKLAKHVYSIRHETPMRKFDKAIAPLEERGYKNVTTYDGSGAAGLDNAGPFDAILVRQSMREPPLRLLKQLKTGGRMVIPIGEPNDQQRLVVYTRKSDGSLHEHETLFMKIAPLLQGREI